MLKYIRPQGMMLKDGCRELAVPFVHGKIALDALK